MSVIKQRTGLAVALAVLISGCAGQQQTQRVASDDTDFPSASTPSSSSSAANDRQTAGGRYAMSGDAYPVEPPDVTQVPDAEPRIEPRSSAGNRSTYEVWGETYHVLPDARGYTRQGTASWYGEKFHGYATSNGEIYDMYKMSAAHRSLPLPTFARVTSLSNGRSVIVRVNDRGPFHSDREIDLSYAAAARLGILDNGTGRVKVEAIDPERWVAGDRSIAPATPAAQPVQTSAPPSPSAAASATTPANAPASPPTAGTMFLQVAAVGNPESAQQLRTRLQSELPHDVRVESSGGVYRVQVGPLSAAQETPARNALRQAGFPQVFVVR
ncbi:septal ring lytic transglycosylase RlpA family protein [Halomonas dongshanensis]|uniref:Endolytic peptidoglycan transglycosylase RlpA n=1 Tax=Halomonas dongshanensis TaxID=2890835 RepID=A0ABT2ECV5_9GAMM|nr:septal ring lytic transglycosylase RlpA family protein [Halomonas dongshanensis]MCS2609407.1 septal ring lytic transglycosylase RlpA family protein [Halomonas dongshanensis]